MNAYNSITPETIQEDMRYLQLLSHSFPTIADASTEIINLEAILNLPKGTEHFLADLHGEYEAFQHVLRNASGAIKRKVNEIFGNTLRENEKKELCTLIYYPEQKLDLVKAVETDLDDWYVITLNQLVRVCQNVSSKYTRSKVRKSLPKEFSYIIQELLHENSMVPNKQAYINVIISTIISTRRADDFIIALCNLIQRLTIDTLHVLGDIFDRGPAPHRIMDILCDYHNFDVQWETMTFYGWEPQPATTAVWQTCYAWPCVMATLPLWRTDMASTFCPWPPLPWKHTLMIPAPCSDRK